jgi:hypothetical protein
MHWISQEGCEGGESKLGSVVAKEAAGRSE